MIVSTRFFRVDGILGGVVVYIFLNCFRDSFKMCHCLNQSISTGNSLQVWRLDTKRNLSGSKGIMALNAVSVVHAFSCRSKTTSQWDAF